MQIDRSVMLCLVSLALLGCGRKKAPKPEESVAANESQPNTKPVEGVTDDEIKLGMVGVFTGPLAQYGTEVWRGAMAYFLELNNRGGVHGRKVRLVAKDDAYDATKTPGVMKSLLDDEDPFVLFTQVGTGQTASTLGLLAEYKPKGVLMFGNFTGGAKQREPAALEQFFHIRASYATEAEGLVELVAASGRAKIGVYYQDDAYGKTVLDGIQKALAARNMKTVAEVPYKPGQKFEVSTADAVQKLKAAGCDLVFLGAVYQPAAAFVRDARESGWMVPVATNSVTTDTMLRYMKAYEAKTSKRISTQVVWSSVVPNYEDTSVPLVREYREAMDKRNPRPSGELEDANYRVLSYSFTGLEGYLNAKILVEALDKTGPKLSRAAFREAAERVTAFDPGVGAMVNLAKHEGLKAVWFIGAKNGQFVTLSKDLKGYFDVASTAGPKR
ncbi:MAG: ABC transporter substrate-binding protein [Polyangiaceae bacterium]